MTATAMTRQQRCEAAITNQPVDRAPAYIPAISCEVSSEILGRKAHTGTGSLHYAEVAAWADGEQAHAEFEQQLMADVLAIHRALDIDVFHLPWRCNRPPDWVIDEYTFLFGDEDGEHEVWQYAPTSGDFAMIACQRVGLSPFERLKQSVEQQEAHPELLPEWARAGQHANAEAQRLHGEEFFVGSGGAGISVGIMEEDMILLATEPDWVRRRCMLQARLTVEVGNAMMEYGCPPVIFGGGDLAGNTGPMYSPAAFREVVLPAYVHAVERLNAIGAHYVFRTDGDIWPLAEMLFVEAGCPGFGEADRDAGMSVAAMRKRYPDLVIWGNVSSSFLAGATPAQVREEAKRVLDEADGRGCFQACSNAIVRGTPAANVEALFSVR